jgi:hypothetical protein
VAQFSSKRDGLSNSAWPGTVLNLDQKKAPGPEGFVGFVGFKPAQPAFFLPVLNVF